MKHFRLPKTSFVDLMDKRIRYSAMADDIELLHNEKRFVSCACLILCFIDAIAAGDGRASRGKFCRFIDEHFPEMNAGLSGLVPGKKGSALLYDKYRDGLAHLFTVKSGFLLAEDHEIGSQQVAKVAIEGKGEYTAINVDRFAMIFVSLMRGLYASTS